MAPRHNVALQGRTRFFGLRLAPALLHFEDLVRSGEGEFPRQRGFAVFFQEADTVALRPARVVHQNAMLMRFPLRHWVHEVGHREIVAI